MHDATLRAEDTRRTDNDAEEAATDPLVLDNFGEGDRRGTRTQLVQYGPGWSFTERASVIGGDGFDPPGD